MNEETGKFFYIKKELSTLQKAIADLKEKLSTHQEAMADLEKELECEKICTLNCYSMYISVNDEKESLLVKKRQLEEKIRDLINKNPALNPDAENLPG